jgi:hypothetical protein
MNGGSHSASRVIGTSLAAARSAMTEQPDVA